MWWIWNTSEQIPSLVQQCQGISPMLEFHPCLLPASSIRHRLQGCGWYPILFKKSSSPNLPSIEPPLGKFLPPGETKQLRALPEWDGSHRKEKERELCIICRYSLSVSSYSMCLAWPWAPSGRGRGKGTGWKWESNKTWQHLEGNCNFHSIDPLCTSGTRWVYLEN